MTKRRLRGTIEKVMLVRTLVRRRRLARRIMQAKLTDDDVARLLACARRIVG